jgi:SNF2 family DNA or RNA helicase
MISAMENQIKILEDEDIIQFKKDKWFNEELELATSLNFEAKNSCIYADLRKVSRKALFEFMSVAYRNFIKGAKWKAFRDFFYEELKHRYDTIYRAYDKDIANRLPYYDKLYDHQKEAIFLMSNRKYNLLSFEQGLGKTITAISVSNMCNIRTTLIVTPSIAKWNWYEELQKWGESKDSITIVDSKKTINSDTEKWIVINFELLKKHYDKLVTRNIQHIVVDEAHYIKNVESKRYDYVFNLATESNAKISLLTGTPIKNKVDDLFSYLRLCKQYLGTSYRKLSITQQSSSSMIRLVLIQVKLRHLYILLTSLQLRVRSRVSVI